MDDPAVFGRILEALEEVQREMPVVFPIHPRTRANLGRLGLIGRIEAMGNLRLIDPAGYQDFLKLTSSAYAVLTDSGGIQEETTILRVPCLTLRENTERPATAELGSNRLVGTWTETILQAWRDLRAGRRGPGGVPPLWDGRAAERIVKVLDEVL